MNIWTVPVGWPVGWQISSSSVPALCPACRPPPSPIENSDQVNPSSRSSARLPKIPFPFHPSSRRRDENNRPIGPVIDYPPPFLPSSRPFFRPPEVFHRPSDRSPTRVPSLSSRMLVDSPRNSCPRSISRPRLIDQFICIRNSGLCYFSLSLPFCSTVPVNPLHSSRRG